MQASPHGMLPDQQVGRVLAVVVDHHLSVEHEIAAIVGKQGEGVDTIGRHLNESGNDQADIAVAAVGNADLGCRERSQERSLIDVGTARTAVVVPLAAEAIVAESPVSLLGDERRASGAVAGANDSLR